MRTAIAFIVGAGLLGFGGDLQAPTECFALSGEVRGWADADSVQCPVPLLAAQPAVADTGVSARLWQWKTIIIVAPGACGVVVLLVRLLLRALRWCWRRPLVDADGSQEELNVGKEVPSPFIVSLVEREHRRAIERAQARQERWGAVVARGKEDISRAA